MSVESAYQYLYLGTLIVMAVLIGLVMVRSIIGPRVTDRILSVNMIGTLVISCIAILSAVLKESYLVDVALIYSMISFVSVIMLASIYLPEKSKRAHFNPQAYEEAKAEQAAFGKALSSERKNESDASVSAEKQMTASGKGER